MCQIIFLIFFNLVHQVYSYRAQLTHHCCFGNDFVYNIHKSDKHATSYVIHDHNYGTSIDHSNISPTSLGFLKLEGLYRYKLYTNLLPLCHSLRKLLVKAGHMKLGLSTSC